VKTNLSLSLAAALAATVSCLALPTPAAAQTYRDTSAGGACKAAAAGSTAITFGNTYLLNKSTVAQYVICHFDMFDLAGSTAQSTSMLKAYFGAGDTAGTPTCVVQIGFYTQQLYTSDISSGSVTIQPGLSDFIAFGSADMVRDAYYQTLTLNCKVPPGFRMGLIERTDPPPQSGSGWTP
jgi:hypothetical protein